MFGNSVKCGKKNGEPCRLHSPKAHAALAEKEQFIRDGLREYRKRELAKQKQPCKAEAEMFADIVAQQKLEAQAEAKREQDFLVHDMEKFMNLTIDPVTGRKTVSVFRSGIVETPKERGVEEESYLYCDNYLPDARQGRNTGIFASPTVNGVSHWVRGVANVVKDCGVRELRVDPDSVYVYSVRSWENFSNGWHGFTPEAAKEYWDSGITLTQWHEKMRTDPSMKPEEWELLLNNDTIQSAKKFSADTVARQAYYSDKGERSTYVYDLLKNGS